MKTYPCNVYPFEPHFSNTGVCRGIPIFLIFTKKHRLWVLVRTASAENFQFLKLKKSLFIAWASFCNANFLVQFGGIWSIILSILLYFGGQLELPDP